MSKEWPYKVKRPSQGQVRACPLCGMVAIFSCWHQHTGSVSTVVINARRAAALREHSGHYRPSLMTCMECGYNGPVEEGSMLYSGGEICAECAETVSPKKIKARRNRR